MKNDGRSIYTQAHPGEEPNPEGGAERRTVLEKLYGRKVWALYLILKNKEDLGEKKEYWFF